MHGKPSLSRRKTTRDLARRTRKASKPSTDTAMVHIGDWTLAQDENGALIIHNVITGNRVLIARPE